MTSTNEAGNTQYNVEENVLAGAGNQHDRSKLQAATEGAAEAYRSARERTTTAYQAARERTGSALESARETATSARRRAGDGVETYPMAAVIGGIALGAVAGALLPTTRREEELFGSVGRRINDTAREAALAARDSAKEQADELGLTKDGVRRKLNLFTDRAVETVRTTATAAAKPKSNGQ